REGPDAGEGARAARDRAVGPEAAARCGPAGDRGPVTPRGRGGRTRHRRGRGGGVLGRRWRPAPQRPRAGPPSAGGAGGGRVGGARRRRGWGGGGGWGGGRAPRGRTRAAKRGGPPRRS